MKIKTIETFVVKVPIHDRFGGQSTRPATFPNSNYYFEEEWDEAYSQHVETLLVRINTDEGLHGWGECQAPIIPEVSREIIDRLLAPMLIGSDPDQTSVLWDRMYHSMNVRGQTSGFMCDAISGLDIAIWDIKGKAAGKPIARMLGGPFTNQIPVYVSGLRAQSRQSRAELAKHFFEEGFPAVKLFLGKGIREDIAEATAVRKIVGDGKRIMCDLFWKYSLPEAEHMGRACEELAIEWIEAPLDPEDVRQHAKLADVLQVAIAVGEPFRTRYHFLEWFERHALDIAQPDVVRCGITEGKRIADLASAWHIPVAYHFGLSLGIGMAASWQLSAATSNFRIMEHEPPLLEISNRFLSEPLTIENGKAVLPLGPGLGVDVDMEALGPMILK